MYFSQLFVSRNSVTNVVLVLLSVLHFVMSCLRGTCVTFWTCIDNRETAGSKLLHITVLMSQKIDWYKIS